MKKYKPKDIVTMALFVSLGIVLQYVENFIFISPVPGGKLGLCNIISIINIFIFGGGNAMVIAFIRALLGTLLTGGASALPYSVSGAILSTLCMGIIKKYFYPKVSMVGMSVVGATVHNFAQICVAAIGMWSLYIFSYLPFLLIVAVISGIITGFGAHIVGKRLLKIGDNNE